MKNHLKTKILGRIKASLEVVQRMDNVFKYGFMIAESLFAAETGLWFVIMKRNCFVK